MDTINSDNQNEVTYFGAVKSGLSLKFFHIYALSFSLLVALYFFFFQGGDGWEIIIAPTVFLFCYFISILLNIIYSILHLKWGLSLKTFCYYILTIVVLYFVYVFITEVILIEILNVNIYNYF